MHTEILVRVSPTLDLKGMIPSVLLVALKCVDTKKNGVWDGSVGVFKLKELGWSAQGLDKREIIPLRSMG